MYEIRCLYTFIYALTEINGGLKRYCLALAWHSSAKNKNQILDSVGRKRAAMAILFGEDGYRNLREQDINREHYLEANAKIEWFKYRMEKKKKETE